MRNITTGKFIPNSDRYIKNDFSVDNPETAYWAGFLYGDGCISTHGKLQVCLSIKDVDHLQQLSRFICGKNYVGQYDNRCHFQITHQTIAKNLQDIWCIVPNKTYVGHLKLDTQHTSDFIRGYFDADGWVSSNQYTNKLGYKYTKVCIGMCSYLEENLQYIHRFLPRTNVSVYKIPGRSLYDLRWQSKVEIDKIARYLYHPRLSLHRKAVKLCQLMI